MNAPGKPEPLLPGVEWREHYEFGAPCGFRCDFEGLPFFCKDDGSDVHSYRREIDGRDACVKWCIEAIRKKVEQIGYRMVKAEFWDAFAREMAEAGIV